MAKREETSSCPPSSRQPSRNRGMFSRMTTTPTGSPGQDGVDDLAHAGDAAQGDLVGIIAPVRSPGHRQREARVIHR